jgi:hypothetical protein
MEDDRYHVEQVYIYVFLVGSKTPDDTAFHAERHPEMLLCAGGLSEVGLLNRARS